MNSKKILILFNHIYGLGGIQKYNRHLCSAINKIFPERGFSGISFNDSPEDSTASWSNIIIYFCGQIKARPIRRIAYVIKALWIGLRERPKFLLCSHVDLSPVALFLKKIYGLNYIVITHGTDVWDLKKGIKYQGLRNAQAITTISRYTKQRMIENGIGENKIELLPDTIDASFFCPKAISKESRLGPNQAGKRILLTVGRIESSEKYKGHDILLKVIERLGSGYMLIVIGEGNDLPRLKEKAKTMQLAKRVIFPGAVSDEELRDYYNLCDLFIMPSTGEGFGIVYLEAMACGKPAIGGNSDGSREPLMDGRLGFLVDADSIEEIIQTIQLAARVKEKRTDPEYLRKEVERNFGIAVFNKRVKEILEERI